MGKLQIDKQSYTITSISTTINGKEIILEFEVLDSKTLRYKIVADDRCPNIVETYKFIQNRINDTLIGKPFMLREDVQRFYIHIKDANTGNEQQYTAHKL